MPARKEQHPCFSYFCGMSVVFFLFFFLVSVGGAFGAGSPFELEIGDLERGDAPSKEVKKPQSHPSAKTRGTKAVAGPDVKAEGQQEGDYIRYMIRPGDNIYTILTKRFGLSSKKAERLIPEIMRINGIVDTSGLQIGQTLLLPLTRKKVVAPQETAPEPVPVPLPEPAPVPAPALLPEAEILSPENPPALPPTVDEGMLRRAKEFWSRLFPERQPVEPATAMEKAGATGFPFLTGVYGKEIRIVPPGMPPAFGNLSGAGAEKWETVVADPANEKGFVKELLQAAGFATTEGGTPLVFGAEPKLSVKVDLTAAQRVPGAEIRKTILVLMEKNGCQALPESLVSYLEAMNFRLLTWCDPSESSPLSSAVQVRFVPSGRPEAEVDAVLDALTIKSNKDHPIEIVVGQNGSNPLSVIVDRYFEGDGKRFFLDFGNAAPNQATLFRLLELAAYQRIVIRGTDDFRTVAAKIFKAMNVSAEYRKYVFSSLPDGRFVFELAGILYPRTGTGGDKIFLTDISPGQPFFDLLKTLPWETQ